MVGDITTQTKIGQVGHANEQTIFSQFSCELKLNFTLPPILNSTNFEVEEKKMSERQFF